MKPNPSFSYVFFGTPEPAVEILEELHARGFEPLLVVTNPDKPQGRKRVLTPSPVKVWTEDHDLPLFQPEQLDEAAIETIKELEPDLFIVVAYGKIFSKPVLDIPKFGSINVHYSLLPKYRGASPVESQILADDKNTGITLFLLDEKMDHGPILAQAPVPVPAWPPAAAELRSLSNKVAGSLLADILPRYISGELKPTEQDHAQATYTKKFATEDGLIDLSGDAYQNYLKFKALSPRFPVFFFVDAHQGNKMRIIIKDAIFNNDKKTLDITRVVPEGKNEMSYADFARGYLQKS